MPRALIFDFDGVIADSEPTHFTMLQRVLGEIGLFLSKDEYYASYLGYDDKGCFEAALAAHGRPSTPADLADLVARKARLFLDHMQGNLVIYPGVREFVHEAALHYRLAIASGALRHEIDFVLEQVGLKKEFEHITSAEDVVHGKPDPEPFLHALASLNRAAAAGSTTIKPEDCAVIEDSIPGIRAARAAGMRVVAVANTHPKEDLTEADVMIASLAEFKVADLGQRLWS